MNSKGYDWYALSENLCDVSDWELVEFHFRELSVKDVESRVQHIEEITWEYMGSISSGDEIAEHHRYQFLDYLRKQMLTASYYHRDPNQIPLFARVLALLGISLCRVEEELEKLRTPNPGAWS